MQVPTPIVEGDGAFSFHIPLPNPKGPIRAFLDRVRSVLSMPLPPYFAPHLNSVVSRAPLAPRRLSSLLHIVRACLCLCRAGIPVHATARKHFHAVATVALTASTLADFVLLCTSCNCYLHTCKTSLE